MSQNGIRHQVKSFLCVPCPGCQPVQIISKWRLPFEDTLEEMHGVFVLSTLSDPLRCPERVLIFSRENTYNPRFLDIFIKAAAFCYRDAFVDASWSFISRFLTILLDFYDWKVYDGIRSLNHICFTPGWPCETRLINLCPETNPTFIVFCFSFLEKLLNLPTPSIISPPHLQTHKEITQK